MGGWRAVITEMEMSEMGRIVGILMSTILMGAFVLMGVQAVAGLKANAEAIVDFQTVKVERTESLLEDVMNGTSTSDDFQMVQEEIDRQYEELLGQINNGG